MAMKSSWKLWVGLLLVGVSVAQRGCDLRSCPCDQRYIPFCGSDGVTYTNKCHLNCAQQCQPQLRVAFEGVCAVPYRHDGGTRRVQRPEPPYRFRPSIIPTRRPTQEIPRPWQFTEGPRRLILPIVNNYYPTRAPTASSTRVPVFSWENARPNFNIDWRK